MRTRMSASAHDRGMPKRDEAYRRYEDKVVDALRELIDAAGGQKKAAKKLGYSQGQVSRIKNREHRPGVPFLVALAVATQKSIDEILGLAISARGADRAAATRELLAEVQRIAAQAAKEAVAADKPERSTVRPIRKDSHR